MHKESSTPQAEHLRFDKLLSENALCQSWLAWDTVSERYCFVKTLNPKSELTALQQDAVITRSFALQRRIKSPLVVTAWRAHRERGRLFVVYPYFGRERWSELSLQVFIAELGGLLSEMAVLVDYLHLLGLVHGDLKLSNFLVNVAHDGALSLRLVDLDFLTEADQELESAVYGTPEFIAPEIRLADQVWQQSDLYALGASLKLMISETADGLPDLPDGFHDLLNAMTQRDPLQRPRLLVPALAEFGLIDNGRRAELENRLGGMVLVSHLHRAARSSFSDPKALRRFFYEQAGVVGIRPEILNEISAGWVKDPRVVYETVKGLLRTGQLTVQGDYLCFHTSRGAWADLVGTCRRVSSRRWLPDLAVETRIWSGAERVRQAAETEYRAGRPTVAVLLLDVFLRQAVNGGEGVSDKFLLSILRLAAQWSQQAGFTDLAAECYARTAAVLRPGDPERMEAQTWLAYCQLMLGRLEETLDTTAQMVTEASTGDREARVRARRLEVYMEASRGDYSGVEPLLAMVRDASDLQPTTVLSVYSTVALIWGWMDELDAQRTMALRAIEYARRHNLLEKTATPYMSLIVSLYKLGRFTEAVQQGRVALRLGRRLKKEEIFLPMLALYVSALADLGRFAQAERQLATMKALALEAGQQYVLSSLSSATGYLLHVSGKLTASKEEYSRHAEMARRVQQPQTLVKMHHNLAEIAYYEGRAEVCRRHCRLGQDLARKLGDRRALSEIDQISTINRVLYDVDTGVDALYEITSRLLKNGSLETGSRGAYLIFMLGDDQARRRAAEWILAEPLIAKQREAPIFGAVQVLAELISDDADLLTQVKRVKGIYRMLLEKGRRYEAMLTAGRIAELYEESGRDRLARTFFEQAVNIAESLGNKILGSQYLERLTTIADEGTKNRLLIQTMHGVSDILRNVTDYDTAMRQLVEFAVDQTGAERGALLVKPKMGDDLVMAAYYNCDEESLQDIRDFSSSVPLSTASEAEPLIIENALNDSRTKDYQSVIYNNILSVLCVPIIRGEDTLGALYLDHHTIPALFDENDLTFIRAIANFSSVMLEMLSDVKSLAITRRELTEDIRRAGHRTTFVTQDRSMLDLLANLAAIARSEHPVLLLGESGTGKDVLAKKIHAMSTRADGPYMQLNCAALPEGMVESELFGVAKGAATGVSERDGKFAAADGGTLFLDEIGDMSLPVQAKLLRVLEDGRFEKVGSNRTDLCDVRIICATNKDIKQMVREGTFREDLYFRINFFSIQIPPLRERPADIPLLVQHFLRRSDRKSSPPRFSPAAIEALTTYQWRGNVRELKNVVERFCIVFAGKEVGISQLPPDIRDSRSEGAYGKEIAESVERTRIEEALIKTQGNQSAASRELGMSLGTLRRRIQKYRLRHLSR